MSQSVRVFPTEDALSRTIAEMLAKDLDRVEPDQYYTVALSGGSTPVHLFRFLSENFFDRISWEKLLVFWVDERCVPPETEDSNFRVAYEELLQNVPLPDANIFRIRGEEDPLAEAEMYSELVTENVPFYNELPQFDLMLLGLGSDGHTASIFPDNMKLFDSPDLYEVALRPDKKQKRITATGKLINNAAKVFFLVTGKEKAAIVSRVIEKKDGWERLPASLVNPHSGQAVWMLDRDAASLLTRI